jgi:NAD(P)-dependent dehydrogenase (short-subunit alcohol dehydrogenase family)
MTVELTRTPSFRLDGKRALVTGASRGIGLSAASALADAGAHVTLAARTTKEIEEAADAIRARGQKAEPLTLDVRDLDAMKASIAAQAPFDILVNNAGTNKPAPFVEVKVEDFDFVFSLNVRAAYFVAQAVAIYHRRWAMSAGRRARSTAPPSTRWKVSPRRWQLTLPRTRSA